MKAINSVPQCRAVQGFIVACCTCSLAWNTAAATRTAGITNAGSPIPAEGGLLRQGAADNFAADEDFLRCVVSDQANALVWFGTSTTPGQVIKVAYDGPNLAPRRVASLILEPGEDLLFTGVIDTNAGYAYFGSATSPGRVVKVSLGAGNTPPTHVGAVTLDPGENDLYASVIDPAAGYAYFATRTTPVRIVKIALGAGNNPPMRVAANNLSSGDGLVRCAVIDPVAGYAYFGTFSDPGHVVKVALGAGNNPPQRVDSLSLSFGENKLTSAVIDRAAGVAWFGTYTSPGRVVKVALGSGNAAPSRLDAVTLNSDEGFLACAATIAGAPGYVLFGCDTLPGAVVKVALGAGAPMRDGAVTLPFGEENLISAANVGGAVVFGANTQPGQVIQVGLGANGQPPTRESALVLARGENDLQSMVIDAVHGYGYLGTATVPGQVVKIRLGKPGQPPQRIAALTLEPGENRPICAVIDVAGGYAWFGTDSGPGRVIKVALGVGDAPPTRVGAVTLNMDERALRCAVIDLTNRYAYFGTAVFQSLGKVVKVALGDNNNPPMRIGAVSLNADEWDFECAVINGAGTHALFGTGLYFAEANGQGKVVKVALGTGNNPPTRVGALTLSPGEELLHSAVRDPLTDYAWFGVSDAGRTTGSVVKVAFEAGNTLPRRVGAAPLASGEIPAASAAVIDVMAGYLVLGGAGPSASRVMKVALGSGEAAPMRVGGIDLPTNELTPHCSGGDPVNALAWFGTSTTPGKVILVSHSQKGFIKGTRIVLRESCALAKVYFYSHRATGRLRLALYARNGLDRNLAWQSPEINNSADGGWIVAPISQGTPSSVQLPAGTYDLCWQVDTTSDVPSYVAGGVGDGFLVPADFGDFPALLTEGSNNWTPTSEAWASYVSYHVPLPVFTRIHVVSNVVTLEWIANPGTSYQVQRCTELLTPPAWNNVGPLVQTNGTLAQWRETGVVNERFYRLELP